PSRLEKLPKVHHPEAADTAHSRGGSQTRYNVARSSELRRDLKIVLTVLILGLLGGGIGVAAARHGENKQPTTAAPTTERTSPTSASTGSSASASSASTTVPLTQRPIGTTTARGGTLAPESTVAAQTTSPSTTTAPASTTPSGAAPSTTVAPTSGLSSTGVGQVPTGGQTARTGGPSLLVPGLALIALGALTRRVRSQLSRQN